VYTDAMKNELVAVKKSNSGLGLFAVQDFKKGDLIIEYTGEKITEAEANRRGGKYLFELNDNWTIDGKGRENKARYLNHSCKPNCYPELDENEEHIYIYAKRAIKAGEELTYNYGKMYFNDLITKNGCLCAHCLEQKATA
jgi:SET domain-containing protein